MDKTSQEQSKTRVFLLYHYFHPDDVISARLFSDLALDLTKNGKEVFSLPSIRSCHSTTKRYAPEENWAGGTIRRIWRPDFRQSSNAGRLLNSLFMLIGWTWKAAFYKRSWGNRKHEVVVIGTDPIFGILAAITWRVFRPKVKIIHWCHDVHPEASIADGAVSANSILVKCLIWMLKRGYRRCDVVADLGHCMRQLLARAGGWEEKSNASNASMQAPHLLTITPWSLVEPTEAVPVDLDRRTKLFGDCKLSLLYSGNLGRAHDFELLLTLARKCREKSINFCFAGRGPGMDWIQSQINEEDTNISTAGFADESELQARLAACDIHMVSLKDNWTGTVVPSKFFGALSIGRPVLYAGSESSCVCEWIQELGVGWNLTSENLDATISLLCDYASSARHMLSEMNTHCWEVYQSNFCKEEQMSKWTRLLGEPEKSMT